MTTSKRIYKSEIEKQRTPNSDRSIEKPFFASASDTFKRDLPLNVSKDAPSEEETKCNILVT